MSFNTEINETRSQTGLSAFDLPSPSNATDPQAAVSSAADVVFSSASAPTSSHSNRASTPASFSASRSHSSSQPDTPMNHGDFPFVSDASVSEANSAPLWYDLDLMHSLASVYLTNEVHHHSAFLLISQGYKLTQETLLNGTLRPTKKTIPFLLLTAEYYLIKGLINDAQSLIKMALELNPSHQGALKLQQKLNSIGTSSSAAFQESSAPQAWFPETGFEGCVIQ